MFQNCYYKTDLRSIGDEMDNKIVGEFIATRRKEKGLTQRELAEKLHVTNKAISKWENGLGFPDIHLIEPLAEALDVSLIELMHGQLLEQEEIKVQKVQQVMETMITLSEHKRKIENRNIIIASVLVAFLMALLFLVVKSDWIAMLIAYFPHGLFVAGLLMLMYGIKRWKQGEKYGLLVVIGIVGIVAPFLPSIVLLLCLFFLE